MSKTIVTRNSDGCTIVQERAEGIPCIVFLDKDETANLLDFLLTGYHKSIRIDKQENPVNSQIG